MSYPHHLRNPFAPSHRSLASVESEGIYRPLVRHYVPRFRVRSETKKYCFPIWGEVQEYDSVEMFIILGLEKIQGKHLSQKEESGNWLAFTNDYLQIDEVEVLNRLPVGSEIILVKRVDAFIE